MNVGSLHLQKIIDYENLITDQIAGCFTFNPFYRLRYYGFVGLR